MGVPQPRRKCCCGCECDGCGTATPEFLTIRIRNVADGFCTSCEANNATYILESCCHLGLIGSTAYCRWYYQGTVSGNCYGEVRVTAELAAGFLTVWLSDRVIATSGTDLLPCEGEVQCDIAWRKAVTLPCDAWYEMDVPFDVDCMGGNCTGASSDCTVWSGA